MRLEDSHWGHKLLVGDKAWEKLLGPDTQLFEAKLTANRRTCKDYCNYLMCWTEEFQNG